MRKFLSTALVLAMSTMLLTGCGNTDAETTNNADTDTTGSETEGTNDAETDDVSDDTTADAAGSEGTLKIGGIGPTTGDAAVYGLAVKNAAQLAVDEINAAGGVNGMTLELNFQDDESDAEKAVNAYNTLKDWNMQVLVGTVTSTPCIAVAEKSAADNLFQLTPSGSAVECIANENVFRVCFSDPNQGKASAQYIGENSLASKVAVIYDSSSVYSSGIYETFAAEAANQNIEIVAAEAFTADSNKDFTVQIQNRHHNRRQPQQERL